MTPRWERVLGVFWAIQTTMDAPRDEKAMRLAESIVSYFDQTNWVLEFNPQPPESMGARG